MSIAGGHSSRVALVTGGTRGIGLAISRALSDQGCTVLAVSRSGTISEEVVSAGDDASIGRIRTYQVDVGADISVNRLWSEIESEWGVDILVNNAANFDPGTAMMLPLEKWLDHFNVKVAGYARFIRAVLPGMRERRWGRIINIGGIAARLSTETTAGIINAGVANLTKMVSTAEVGNGITVNTVHPGVTDTGRHRQLISARAQSRGTEPSEEAEKLRMSLPMGRPVSPQAVASLVSFLATEQAGAITGQAIAVDGGLSASVEY